MESFVISGSDACCRAFDVRFGDSRFFPAEIAMYIGGVPSDWHESDGEWPVVRYFPDGRVADVNMLDGKKMAPTEDVINDTLPSWPCICGFRV